MIHCFCCYVLVIVPLIIFLFFIISASFYGKTSVIFEFPLMFGFEIYLNFSLLNGKICRLKKLKKNCYRHWWG